MYTLLLLLTSSAFALNISNYANEDITYPKCCPRGFYLRYASENSTLTCYEDLAINLQINSESVENYTENCNEKCVDFLVMRDGIKLILPNCDDNTFTEFEEYTEYPKCCPVEYVYDPIEHRCVFNTSTGFTKQQGVFVKVDLSQCRDGWTALIDHVDVEGVVVDSDKGILLGDGSRSVYGRYCYDVTGDGRNVVRTCEAYEDVCMQNFDDPGVRCLKKCCPDGQIYINAMCTPMVGFGMNVSHEARIKNNEDYVYGIIQVPNKRKYMAKEKHKFSIDRIGNLHVREVNHWRLYTSDKAIYCMEYANMNNATKSYFFLFIMEDSKVEKIKFDLSAVTLSISCVFATITLVCYMLLPDMHNLYGKSIMMYCLVLTVGFAILAYVQFEYKSLNQERCTVLGFMVQYSFLACFSWLNVICFDMWMAFGQMRVKGLSSKKKDFKRFIYYNIYGWSVPTIITLLTYTAYKTKCLPEYLVPHVGTIKCFFDKMEGTYDHFLFFVGPLTILIVANSVFFLKTIIYCFKVKDQINKMKTSPSNDRTKRSQRLNADMEKLMMLLKLCLIMGISWLFEVVSSIVSFKGNMTTEIIEAVWDIFNCLQGVFIFCIFILKKNVLTSLKNKFYPSSALDRGSSETSTAMTSVSGNAKIKNGANGRKISEVKMISAA